MRDVLLCDVSNPLFSNASKAGAGFSQEPSQDLDDAQVSTPVPAQSHLVVRCRVARPLPLGVARYALDAAHYGRGPVSRLAGQARGPDCDDVDSSHPPSGARGLQSGSLFFKVLLTEVNVKHSVVIYLPNLWSVENVN